MSGFGGGPEVGDGEAGVEVGAKVPHPADGKHDVHAELHISVRILYRAEELMDRDMYLEHL